MTERQKYELLNEFKGFELRRYAVCSVAEVESDASYSDASQGAFGSLFQYISRGNSGSEKIGMTAPVIATTTSGLDSKAWKIAFVMPVGMSVNELPHPNNARVSVRELPAQECVALSFKGRANAELCKKQEELLRSLARSAEFSLSEETRIARFDPPFKPGFLQYNEIVIPLSR